MTDDGIPLTRRKLLASVSTIGVAGAGAGLGTSAYFTDGESFTGNTLTAGKLNLRVSVDIVDKSPELPYPDISPKGVGADDTADGDTVTIWVCDMKPGDWFLLEWNAEVIANPGYVQVTSVDDDYANNEGVNPESETDTSGAGDLGDRLLTTIWHAYNNTNSGRQYLDTLDTTTDNNDSGLNAYETPSVGGLTTSGAHYTTANEAHAVYKTGVTLRDPNTGSPLEVGTNTDGEGAHFYQLFELPPGVGNDIQGDELVFTLRFDAEQVRNNANPFA
jgi:predicted ribosomally synthesized peptide with SipW-like signal peptide